MTIDRAVIQQDLEAAGGGGIDIKVKVTHDREAPLTRMYWTDKGATTKVPMHLIVTVNAGKIRSPGTLDEVMDRLRAAVIEERPPSEADDQDHPTARAVANYRIKK